MYSRKPRRSVAGFHPIFMFTDDFHKLIFHQYLPPQLLSLLIFRARFRASHDIIGTLGNRTAGAAAEFSHDLFSFGAGVMFKSAGENKCFAFQWPHTPYLIPSYSYPSFLQFFNKPLIFLCPKEIDDRLGDLRPDLTDLR